jgi:hypothetical protein
VKAYRVGWSRLIFAHRATCIALGFTAAALLAAFFTSNPPIDARPLLSARGGRVLAQLCPSIAARAPGTAIAARVAGELNGQYLTVEIRGCPGTLRLARSDVVAVLSAR